MRSRDHGPDADPSDVARPSTGIPSRLPSEFICTVHGVCFENRYRKLGRLAKGDPLYLQREHGSRIDANAIRVMDPRVEQLGYVPSEISRWLAPLLDRGRPTQARVHRVSSEDIPYYERLVIAVEVR